MARPVDDDDDATRVYDSEGALPKVPKMVVASARGPNAIAARSMKTPAELSAARPAPHHPEPPRVQIRPISRAQTATPAHGLGSIAPPRDPKVARERKLWSLVFWGSIVVIIASLVALVVWLIAR